MRGLYGRPRLAPASSERPGHHHSEHNTSMILQSIKTVGRGVAAAAAGLCALPVMAAKELNMPVGVTELSSEIYELHMLILWVCVAIAVVVFGAMIYSI